MSPIFFWMSRQLVSMLIYKDMWDQVQLRNMGTTIILTTHYLEEAEQMADESVYSIKVN